MTVLIAKQNQEIIKGISKVKFIESTKNTCTFNISEKKFLNLLSEIRLLGYNPYALMSWQFMTKKRGRPKLKPSEKKEASVVKRVPKSLVKSVDELIKLSEIKKINQS